MEALCSGVSGASCYDGGLGLCVRVLVLILMLFKNVISFKFLVLLYKDHQ